MKVVQHDKEVDALYVKLDGSDKRKIDRTIEVDIPSITLNIDVDANGKPIGVEII